MFGELLLTRLAIWDASLPSMLKRKEVQSLDQLSCIGQIERRCNRSCSCSATLAWGLTLLCVSVPGIVREDGLVKLHAAV
jgi:hypothetical protein